jgi:hypothetical protein
MSNRPAGRWPVSRTTARVLAAAAATAVVAWQVPATRGGLFLLAAAACIAGLVFKLGMRL